MAEAGFFSLLLALAVNLYSILAFILGVKTNNQRLKESAKGGVLANLFLVSIASSILIYFLVTNDYSVKYVYEHTSKNLPLLYKLAAFWAGNSGSLLFWTLVLSIYTSIVTFFTKEDANKIPYVSSILLFNNFFFLFLLVFISSPFDQTAGMTSPVEGKGLNPMLQNPGMIFHPITLYFGYVGFAIPFAYALTALLKKDVGDTWIKITRRWTVVSWLFLSLGNLFGAQWAYVELGWGGFWAWDPVENASFMPWLTGTAFLHSVMIQERRDMLKIWNMVLIMMTYILTIFGTYLVRSGILNSVHAFSNSGLGRWFLLYMIFVSIVSFYLLITRINLLKKNGKLESYISKESSFLANNLLLVGAAFATFWGTVFPLISEAIRGIRVTVSVPYFNKVNSPILLLMVLLMGVCPLIAWRKTSLNNLWTNFRLPFIFTIILGIFIHTFISEKNLYGTIAFSVCAFVIISIIQEFYRGVKVRCKITGENTLLALFRLMVRNPRRYGGYIVHLGIVFIALAVIGSGCYKVEKTVQLVRGQKVEINDYELTFNGIYQKPENENIVVYADIAVEKNERLLHTLTPEKIFYKSWKHSSTEVDIYGSLKEDLYVALLGWENNGNTATFKIHVNPLMNWMWIGGYVLIIGTIFALWPGRGSRLGPKYNSGRCIA